MASVRSARLLCVACALRSAGALQGAGVLSAPRPALPRSARPQAVLEHLHVLPDAAAWLEQAPSLLKHAPSLVENAPSLVEHGPSLVEHGPSLTVAAQSASGEVAQVLKDGSIVVVPKSQAGLYLTLSLSLSLSLSLTSPSASPSRSP